MNRPSKDFKPWESSMSDGAPIWRACMRKSEKGIEALVTYEDTEDDDSPKTILIPIRHKDDNDEQGS